LHHPSTPIDRPFETLLGQARGKKQAPYQREPRADVCAKSSIRAAVRGSAFHNRALDVMDCVTSLTLLGGSGVRCAARRE